MKIISLCILFAFLFVSVSYSHAASNDITPQPSPTELDKTQAELSAKEGELSKLTDKIDSLKKGHQTATNEAELVAEQLRHISGKVQLAELQLKKTKISITNTSNDLDKITSNIKESENLINIKRQQLGDTLRSLYEHEQRNTTLDIFLGADSLSTFIINQEIHHDLTAATYELVQGLQKQKQQLESDKEELEKKQAELESLHKLQAAQHVSLANTRQEKKNFLSLKRQEQANYKNKIAEAIQAREEIENQIFTLKNVGLQLAVNDAFQAARYASNLTGVKPSLILAIVKIESNVGEWTGSGEFPDDMHPLSRDAFIRITEKLGLDPYNTPISRRPTSYQGWGGAIGPGQVMPDTWERLEGRVSSLMSKPVPDPFQLVDSLVAVGIMLADRGAADPARQLEAVCRYLAGPNWQYHGWYGAKVLAVAKEYEAGGL